MKAKVFIFGTDPEKNRLFDFMVANTFNSVTEADGILYFPTVRDATAKIGEAFQSVEAVVFFAAEEMFAEVKHILCKALGLRLRVDEDLFRRVLQSGDADRNDSAAAVCHAGIPEKGDVFALSDGKFSGFGVRRGKQTVVVLPVGLFRTGSVLAEQVIPYLNDRYDTELPTDYAAHIFAFSLEEKLHDTDITVAISDTKTAALFRRYVASAGRLQEHMPIAAKAEQRGNIPPNEYVVNLSITAAEFFRAPYGIAMSNAYYTGEDARSEKKVYLAVTSPEENTVREITSHYGESTASFLQRCCGEMCILLEQVIDADMTAAPAGTEEEEPEKEDKKKNFHAIFSVLLALLAVVVAFGVYYFIEHDYTLKDWARRYVPALAVFFDGKEETAGTSAARETEAADADAEDESETEDEETATTEKETEADETTTKQDETTTSRPVSHTASPTMPAYYFTTEPTTEKEEEKTTAETPTAETPTEAPATEPVTEAPVTDAGQEPATPETPPTPETPETPGNED